MTGRRRLGSRQRRQLQPFVESVSTLAGFDLEESVDNVEPLHLGKAEDGGLLRSEPEAGPALALS